MDVQEFRDRCARAMGWVVVDSKPSSLVDGKLEWLNIGPWHPDTDYNQAMMMRDAIPKYDRDKFIDALLSQKQMSFGRATAQKVRIVAFTTPLQIAEAALKVLEAK